MLSSSKPPNTTTQLLIELWKNMYIYISKQKEIKKNKKKYSQKQYVIKSRIKKFCTCPPLNIFIFSPRIYCWQKQVLKAEIYSEGWIKL